jgi:hypothetical protein
MERASLGKGLMDMSAAAEVQELRVVEERRFSAALNERYERGFQRVRENYR